MKKYTFKIKILGKEMDMSEMPYWTFTNKSHAVKSKDMLLKNFPWR